MNQPALALHHWTDAAPPRRSADDELRYFLTRAGAEDRRAAEASHPAARRAHQRMAMLYRQRALAALVDAG